MQYLELLATHKPKLSWDEDAEELYFVYKDKTGKAHTVYYPSLYFLKRRLSLASDMGTGIRWGGGGASGLVVVCTVSVLNLRRWCLLPSHPAACGSWARAWTCSWTCSKKNGIGHWKR
jgi:hypothetical protein